MSTGTPLVMSWPKTAAHGATEIAKLLSEHPVKVFDSPDDLLGFLLEGESVDCVFLGAERPHELTVQAVRRFRENRILDHVPILVLDPEQSTDLEVEALATGANGVLPLGSDLRLLKERVASAVRMARLVQSLRFKIDEMDHFVRTLTHDLKNPVSAIVSSSELLDWELSNANIAEVQSLAESMKKYAQGALEMIDELMQLLRDGQTITDFKDEDSRVVVNEALENLEAFINLTRAEVQLDGEFPLVRCNRSRLVHVFTNLIGNAIKYVAPGTTPQVVVRGIDTPFAAIFCVVDNGIGIPGPERQSIFEPFVRLSPEEYEGTGIGLSIVKRIVQAHDGAVFVQSQEGRGSEFFILLPHNDP